MASKLTSEYSFMTTSNFAVIRQSDRRYSLKLKFQVLHSHFRKNSALINCLFLGTHSFVCCGTDK